MIGERPSLPPRGCSLADVDLIGITLALLVVLILIMVGLARAFQGHSVRDLLDWQPTRSPEVEAQNEVDDVRQMIEAQNSYRRKRGAKEITEADVQRQAAADQAVRARGAGPFKQPDEVVDELDAGPKKLRPPKNPRKRRSAKSPKPRARKTKGK